jgi:CheY-like chemotaxis protein
MGILGFDTNAKRQRPLVLVADDNSQLSEMLCELLSALNCDTMRAENGAETLKLVAGKKPDLVLLDAVMPNMSGISVLRTLKQDPDTRSIPVIMVSGEQKGNDLDMAFNLGAAGYVIKPVRKTELDAKVKAVLFSIGFSPAP